MEVTNRFKGLDLIEYLKKYGRKFMTLYSSSDQDHSQEKKCKKGKWFSEEALQIAEKKREARAKETRKDIHI